MTFPQPPSFITGTPNGLWWKYQAMATETVACQTQGLTLIKNAQRYLRTSGVVADTIWGATASRLNIVIDGIPGPNTIKVLAATLIDQGRGAEVLADLEADYRQYNRTNSIGADYSTPGGPLSMGTLRALIWAASHERGDPNRVVIAPGYIPARWGVAPANDGAAASVVSCWNLSEARPVAPTEPTPTTTTTTTTGGGGSSGGGGTLTTTGGASSSSSNEGLWWGLGGLGVALTAGAIGIAASGKRKRKG